MRERLEDAPATRARAAQALGLDPDLPTLVVTGGSLGAASLNSAMVGVLSHLVDSPAQVLHLTGHGKAALVETAVAAQDESVRQRYQVREYAEDMQEALAVADLVLCRAGAGTVAELTALGIPAVYVPLPIGNGEQRLNAQPAVDAGGGLLVEDAKLTPQWIASRVLPLLQNPTELQALARSAARVGRPDGAKLVADLVLESISEGR